jgi:hypothetical protein
VIYFGVLLLVLNRDKKKKGKVDIQPGSLGKSADVIAVTILPESGLQKLQLVLVGKMSRSHDSEEGMARGNRGKLILMIFTC